MRRSLAWQACATLAALAAGAWGAGGHGALSAFLGGAASIVASLVFAGVASLGNTSTASDLLRVAIRAEAAKILTIVVWLWAVLSSYGNVVIVAFIGSFIAATVMVVSASALPGSVDRSTGHG